jgi:hypothetical protein
VTRPETTLESLCSWRLESRDRLTLNLLIQKRKTAVTNRKESDWNKANQQSVMNSFSLQALFPSPIKKNKTGHMHTAM